jgi:murein L,D-transpeptidase YafK
METKKIMTDEERKKKQHEIIREWKKNYAEGQAEFERKLKTPEYKAIFKELRAKNAKRRTLSK